MIIEYLENNNSFSETLSNSKNLLNLISKIESQYISKYKNKIIIRELFDASKRVNDVWRYTLTIKDNNSYYVLQANTKYSEEFSISNFNDLSTNELNDTNICLLVIESPHKDEYTNDGRFLPKGPAQGTTGLKIERYIEYLFNQHIVPNLVNSNNQDFFHLIICNPVQFQTSIFETHKQPLNSYTSVRDNIWKFLFEKFNEKENFLERLNNYNPLIVINACTSNLKKIVRRELNNSELDFLLFESNNHPCIWSENTLIEFITDD